MVRHLILLSLIFMISCSDNEVLVQEAVEEVMEEVVEEETQEDTEEAAQGETQESAQEETEESAQENTEGSAQEETQTDTQESAQEETQESMQEDTQESAQEDLAKITNVVVQGQANNYTFSVTIASQETGCDQYADWWEVFTEDGTLIYRRILAHSHVDEQPFTRSGGPVNVGTDDFVYVRAHMNNLGYGTQVFSGTVRDGLVLDNLATSFAESLESQEPLPTGCAF